MDDKTNYSFVLGSGSNSVRTVGDADDDLFTSRVGILRILNSEAEGAGKVGSTRDDSRFGPSEEGWKIFEGEGRCQHSSDSESHFIVLLNEGGGRERRREEEVLSGDTVEGGGQQQGCD